MGEPPCTELAIRRAQVAEIARAVLDGKAGILAGARELARLRLDVDPGEEDADLLAMNALTPNDAERAEREAELRDAVFRTWSAIAARYGRRD